MALQWRESASEREGRLKDRKFGVEIEHGNKHQNDSYYVRQKLAAKYPRWNNVGMDGTGVEVRSPILQGQSGFDELGEVMEFLASIGGYVTKSDGMHVHHDVSAEKGDFDLILRVVESYARNQTIIDQLVDPYRKQWSLVRPEWIQGMKEKKVRYGGRTNCHLSGHGTIEFRQFEGCLEPAKAKAWIEFGQHFVEYALGRRIPMHCSATPTTLLKRIGCDESVEELLFKGRGKSTTLKNGPNDGYVRQNLLSPVAVGRSDVPAAGPGAA